MLSDCSKEKLFVFCCFFVTPSVLEVLYGASEQLVLVYDSPQLFSFYYGLRKVLSFDASLNVVLSHTPLSVYSRSKERGKKKVYSCKHKH